MNKKSSFSTKMLVATGLGAALFLVLFKFISIPSPIPSTNFQIAYAVAGFFGAIFGPVCSALVAFIGHALNDATSGWGIWWSWVIASGVSGAIMGLSYYKINFENGFGKKEIITFNLIQIVANVVAWLLVAPVLDIVIYAEPMDYVFAQGIWAAIMNAISTGVVGTLLLIAYASRQVKEGSLDKE